MLNFVVTFGTACATGYFWPKTIEQNKNKTKTRRFFFIKVSKFVAKEIHSFAAMKVHKINQMQLTELTTIDEMISQFEIIRELYPEITLQKYQSYLEEMIPHNYKQLAVFENQICIGLTGFWTGTKLWSGKYIEIDNFIVHSNH